MPNRAARVFGMSAVACACSHPAAVSKDAAAIDAAIAPAISLTLDRETSGAPYPIDVTATLAAAIPGTVVTVTAPGGTVAAVQARPGGLVFTTTIVPTATSGELPITATATLGASTSTATTRAVVLPTVDAAWNQPVAVAGLVNTPGYEDGPVISPDGEWLLVSSYSPADDFCCTHGCRAAKGDPTVCQTSNGPSTGPARPGMFGADRIVDATHIKNQCPKLCLVGAGGTDSTIPLGPPVAAFAFHRQADGSFAEPAVFGFDGDGCTALFGASFVGAPSSTGSSIVFAYSLTLANPNHIFYAPLALGGPAVLGTYSCVAGSAELTGSLATELVFNPSTANEGNPYVAGNRVWTDDESQMPSTLSVTAFSGTLPTATLSPTAAVPVGLASDDRRQAFLDGSTLFYYSNGVIASATLTGDPTLAGSWSTPATVLAPETTPYASAPNGAILVLGQPTIAKRNADPDELYFVYALVTATGADFNVGRVTKRP